MDIEKMLEAQKKLDNAIIAKHEINLNEQETIANTLIALDVELAELANELQFFKIWKKNKNLNENKILEELADCLHFALSLTNKVTKEKSYFYDVYATKTYETIVKRELQNKNMTKEFIELKKLMYNTKLIDHHDAEGIMFKILRIAVLSSFTFEQLENAYFAKNKINYDRLKNNY